MRHRCPYITNVCPEAAAGPIVQTRRPRRNLEAARGFCVQTTSMRRNVTRLFSVVFVPLALLASAPTTAVGATAPTVRTGRASAVAPQTATIGGSVDPNGVPTAFFFRFGRTNA